jgi:transposase
MLADAQRSCYVHQRMNTYQPSSKAQACGAQVASEASSRHASHVSAPPQYQPIKLALDVPAASIVVGRLIDGAKPQPPQTFKPADFLAWAKQPVALAKEVLSGYEAGPTGFWRHRQLTELGVTHYGVCPTRLDERPQGVANDRKEALALATRWDRYVAGNDRALAVVRVPTEAEEPKRAHKRPRQQRREPRLSLAAQGRRRRLWPGRRESNHGWPPAGWARLEPELAGGRVERLKVFRRLILAVNQAVRPLTGELEAQAPKVLPKGMGRLTYEAIETEVAAWDRFKNRRQVGSDAGLTGGLSASGQSSADLSLTQAGNRRLRTDLVELAWRLLLYLPRTIPSWAAALRGG